MGLFENKKLRELEKENEELLFRINSIAEKEDNVRNLNDVLKKMRMEVSDLNERKLSLSSEIESLREQKRQNKADIEGFNKEILNLRQLKLEEQNTLLDYSSRIDRIKNQISNNENLRDTNFDAGDEIISDRSKEIEALNKEYDELKDKMFAAEEKIDELNSFEDELNERISQKKKELESLNNKKLKKSIKDIGDVENKISELTEEQHIILDEIHEKENEITELNKKLFDLKEKENNSVNLLKELDEEVKEKTKQAEFLGSKISTLYE